MRHKELTYKIIGVFYDVYNELVHGFLESVYHKSLGLALEAEGLNVSNHVKIAVSFRGQRVGMFEGDLLVENTILLELKTARLPGPFTLRAAAELSQSYGYRGGPITETLA